ncbi:sugar transferase, partial [Clostridium perfringens]|nr:sugar transferase [Clostridium perfringens]
MERIQIENEEIIEIEKKESALYEISKRFIDIIASFLGLTILS